MVACESTDAIYPMLADIYYPIVEQGAYGDVKRNWVLDKTIACSFERAGISRKQDVKPDVKINIDNVMIGRVKSDVRFSTQEVMHPITNILITNIRDKSGNVIYLETAGPRAGLGTTFEIVSFDPVVGLFGSIDLYKLVVKRSENQGTDI